MYVQWYLQALKLQKTYKKNKEKTWLKRSGLSKKSFAYYFLIY